MLQSFSSRANYSLQFFSLSAGSAAASRNLGASNARGDVLLFLDDDVLAHPDLVRAHVTAQRDERVAIGYSKPVYQTPLSWWHYGARRWWEDTFSEMRRPGHRFTFRDFLTGNVSLPAALFRRVGGFDTAFSDAGYEDYELGVRLLEAGARFCFVPEAVGYHHDETNLGRSLLRTRREGIGIVRIGKRHPEMIGTALKFPETNSWVTKRLRALAFNHSGLGDRIARLLVRQAEFFERTRLRAPWQHTVAWLRCYNFWRGVASAAGSEREFYDWLEGIAPPPAVAGDAPVLELTSLPDRGSPAANPGPRGQRWVARVDGGGRGPGAGASAGRRTALRATRAGCAADAGRAALRACAGISPCQTILGEPPTTAKLAEVDLTRALEPVYVDPRYAELHLLVRWGYSPLGVVRLPCPPNSRSFGVAQLREEIYSWFSHCLLQRAVGGVLDTLTEGDDKALPAISVVVCTRDRPVALDNCLQSLRRLDYEAYEVLVVDNASRDGDVAQVAARNGFRCVREETAGLDWARNRGIDEARHDIIAFIDDDALASPGWLRGLARGFEDPTVMAVTGLVLPAELETGAQVDFENYGGMGKGFLEKTYRREALSDTQLFWASSWGVGTNMAFRRALPDRIGRFDVALDVGTPTRGGGDIEFLHRTVAGGHVVRYEPAALVRHTHRRQPSALKRQLYSNGRAFGAYLLTAARTNPSQRTAVVRFALRSWMWGWLLRRLLGCVVRRDRGGFHRALIETSGALSSPLAYRRAIISTKRTRISADSRG